MIDRASSQRIGVAAAVSGAVHFGLIAFGEIELPQKAAEPPPLAVRIETLPAPAVAMPHVRARPRAARTPRVLAVASAPSFVAQPRPAETTPVETGVAIEPPVTEPAAATAVEPIVVAKAEPSTFTPDPAPVRTLPRKGRITYNLVYGRDRFPVGRTVQSWEIEGEQYRLASTSETTGIIDFFRSQHRNYFSRGTVTREGLRPSSFLMSRNRGRGLEEARVQFDWPGGMVTLGSATEQRREPLPAGSQDLVSFVYQLALDPPRPGRVRVPVTNGMRLETYELDVLPEEFIETPLGRLRALPLRQVRNAREESIELWLATEYRYLPVRIRFFNRDGEPAGEQIVSEIRLSEE